MAWRQAITWTNADPAHPRICTTLGGDESMHYLKLKLLYLDWSSAEIFKDLIDNVTTSARAMARHWVGDKPLLESVKQAYNTENS